MESLEEVEEDNINGIVLANEVLDALPVERITFSKEITSTSSFYRQKIS